MLDKQRALICAGVFCLVAVTGGARAAMARRPRLGTGYRASSVRPGRRATATRRSRRSPTTTIRRRTLKGRGSTPTARTGLSPSVFGTR
jgi:hypothetical protein